MVSPGDADQTVLEALSNAGGFKEFANQKKIRILRNGAILKFNYKEVTNGNAPGAKQSTWRTAITSLCISRR